MLLLIKFRIQIVTMFLPVTLRFFSLLKIGVILKKVSFQILSFYILVIYLKFKT